MVDWAGARLPGLDGDKVVIVTGAGGEMGGRTAQALLAMGVRTALFGRTQTSLDETVKNSAAPDLGLAVACDVADPEAVRAAVDQVAGHFGRLDGVVNCAAVGDGGTSALDVTPELARAVTEVDYFGTLWLSQAAHPHLKAAGGGSIVLVSSVAQHRVMKGGLLYASAKAAMTRMARSLALEWGPDGIRVNVMSPGQTPTRLVSVGLVAEEKPSGTGASAQMVPLRRRGLTDDYVGALLFLLSDLSAYVTGHDLPVEGGVVWPRVAVANTAP
jgi:meso-butanediol dehydrogenase / (S,S)-butanediol dehydrogenase / diacetyl reductase